MSSVKKDLITGAAFTAIAKYSGLVVQLVITAILARLISPSDFGIVAIATVFIFFFNILSDIGIGPAIIQNKALNNADVNNIFSLTVYLGIISSTIFFIASWGIASIYAVPQLKSICQLLCIPILFYSLNIVPNALLLKEKKFKFIAIRTLISQIVSGAIAVICAFCGWKIYALLVNPILSSIIIFILSYKVKPQTFVVKIKKDSILKIFSFSIFQFLFNILNYFSRNLDKLLIGRFLGMTPLGYYDKSYRLMMLPLQNIIFVINPVFQPIFSEFQDNIPKLREYYLKILRLLSWLAFPISILIFFISKELILCFFGEQWKNAIPVFQILSLTICMQILISTTGAIYQSVNATKELFISGLWGAIFLILGFSIPIICYKTIEAVAIGYVLAQIANFIQCFCLLFKKINYSFYDFLKNLVHPIIISGILAILMWIIFSNIEITNNIISLITKSLLFSVSLLSYLIYIKVINLKSIRNYIYKR